MTRIWQRATVRFAPSRAKPWALRPRRAPRLLARGTGLGTRLGIHARVAIRHEALTEIQRTRLRGTASLFRDSKQLRARSWCMRKGRTALATEPMPAIAFPTSAQVMFDSCPNGALQVRGNWPARAAVTRRRASRMKCAVDVPLEAETWRAELSSMASQVALPMGGSSAYSTELWRARFQFWDIASDRHAEK